MLTRLTRLLSALPLAERVLARRCIELIADRWAIALEEKYGHPLAIGRCRQKLVASLNGGGSIRHHIWSLVFRRLHPPEARWDRENTNGLF